MELKTEAPSFHQERPVLEQQQVFVPARPSGQRTELTDMVDALTEPGWKRGLSSEFDKPYFEDIAKFVAGERKRSAVYPEANVWCRLVEFRLM